MHLTIDGRIVEATPGQTVLDAARAAGIYIPALCYHPKTGKAGRCRACVVEVDGLRGLKESCALPVKEGMVVHTNTPKVVATRRMVVELLIGEGHHNCMSCQANGDCELQEMAYQLGIERPSYLIETEPTPLDVSSLGIVREADKCIHCGRCVTACQHGVVNEVLAFAYRGNHTKVVCDDDLPMGDSSCVQCGECVQVCPVGALVLARPWQRKIRSYDTQVTKITCPYCGVGCQIDMHTKDNKYAYAMAHEGQMERQPNKGMLCVKGRFGLDFVDAPDRLRKPLIRKDGELTEASWEEALDLVEANLRSIKETHGADALGFLSSAKVTNEENYAMNRLSRAVFGTNNIDHCARLCHSATVAGLATTLGSGAMTNSLEDALDAKIIMVIGTNTTWNHPVLGSLIKQAVKNRGAKLIVCDPRRIDLVDFADIWLQQRNGSDVALLQGLQHIILKEGWEAADYIRERTEGFEAYRKALDFYTPEKVQELTGVKIADLYAAAKLWTKAGVGALYFSMGITQHSHGVDNVNACVNLQLITGNLGVKGGGVNPLRGQTNVQGACDMGALPVVYTGYQPVTNSTARERFSAYWKAPLPEKVGMTVTQMIPECGNKIRGMYIMGENPMLSDPNLNHVEECLKKLDFLVVQDIFLTETARLAHVVLPGVTFAEKVGTFTNTERRVQLSNQAIRPIGDVRQDYEIIADLAARFGHEFPRTPEGLFQEIRDLTPSYAGLTYDRIREVGIPWPCPTVDHPGTPILHIGKFARGLALLSPLVYRPPAEEPDAEYELVLSTGRMLEHFHTGSMSRRSEVLDGLVPHGHVELHPEDASKHGIATGDRVAVSTRRGRIETAALVTDRVAPGSIFIPFHFAEAAANVLTNDALDPVAKIPEYKVCAARIERVGAGAC
ncbi:MAG: formate dehydrogenase subunit alpha [Bradymonadales bacterium]|nr:formate dehydrogenase subunit alpha [Bradymonadales bacterium]